MSIKDAFKKLCQNASVAEPCYVCLYVRTHFYGGPEEGGWEGEDTTLVEYFRVSTREVAESLAVAIEADAAQMTADAKWRHGERCLEESEWLDARGLDDDFLSEPVSPDEYFVVVESTPGVSEQRGNRHYE